MMREDRQLRADVGDARRVDFGDDDAGRVLGTFGEHRSPRTDDDAVAVGFTPARMPWRLLQVSFTTAG